MWKRTTIAIAALCFTAAAAEAQLSQTVNFADNCVLRLKARWQQARTFGGRSMESDVSYFRRRASEERTAALNSRRPEARKSHLEMAERYEDLVHAIMAREEHLGLRIVSST